MNKQGMVEWIQENVSDAKDREQFIAECEKRFGNSRKRVLDAISHLRLNGKIPRDAILPAAPKNALSSAPRKNGKNVFRLSVDLSEIAGEFDEEAKILKGLETLGTRLIKDNDFRVELGVPIDRWKVVGNLPKFGGNKRELKGKRFRGIYWGSSAVIKELSRKIDILP